MAATENYVAFRSFLMALIPIAGSGSRLLDFSHPNGDSHHTGGRATVQAPIGPAVIVTLSGVAGGQDPSNHGNQGNQGDQANSG